MYHGHSEHGHGSPGHGGVGLGTPGSNNGSLGASPGTGSSEGGLGAAAPLGSCFGCIFTVAKEVPCIYTAIKNRDPSALLQCGIGKTDVSGPPHGTETPVLSPLSSHTVFWLGLTVSLLLDLRMRRLPPCRAVRVRQALVQLQRRRGCCAHDRARGRQLCRQRRRQRQGFPRA